MSRGLSLSFGGLGALPREKKWFSGWLENDFKPLLWKEICFLSRNFFIRNVHVFFFHITHVRSVRNGRYAFVYLFSLSLFYYFFFLQKVEIECSTQ